MKKNILLFVFALLSTLTASAYDAEIDGIFYDLNTSTKKATVTYKDYNYNSYTDSVTIPETVTFEGLTYSVSDIGYKAFEGCSSLTSVTIPNSVSDIGYYAFEKCSHLTSFTIPSSVTWIGKYAFKECSSLTFVTIPNSVTSIGEGAFYNCSSLTSITIPNSVKTIEAESFRYCYGLTSVSIPNSVTSIGIWAFEYCSITSITIPNSVTTIGGSAFYGNKNLQRVEINHDSQALPGLWYSSETKDICYDLASGEKLSPPSLRFIFASMTTASLEITNYYPNFSYTLNGTSGNDEIDGEGKVKIKGLSPGKKYEISFYIRLQDGSFSSYRSDYVSFTTQKMRMGFSEKKATASSIEATVWYDTNKNDVQLGQYLTIDEQSTEGNKITAYGLEPDKEYAVTLTMTFEGNKSYSVSQNLKTEPLSLVTGQPKGVSAGNVIVAATTNIDESEENIGFEWRRTDWTTEFASKMGSAKLYENTMEGYIQNLFTEKLWKCRAYYLSNSGMYYYGDWVGIDPTDFSYFEPTVHTYADITTEGNAALVKGYVLNGTDRIKVQGFKYWKSVSMARGTQLTYVSDDAKTIEAEGQVMDVTLKDLDYESEYTIVAFATTTDGDTYYGEERTFTTGKNPSGLGKCATPIISFVDGKLIFDCETEGVKYVSNITPPSAYSSDNDEVGLRTTYIVSVYAKKEGYENSEVATKEIELGGGSTAKKGDVNEDGTVNGTDIQEVINVIISEE